MSTLEVDMTLKEFMAMWPGTKKEFAERAGVSRQHLYNILNGTNPNVVTALKIEKATGGLVRCEDLRCEDG